LLKLGIYIHIPYCLTKCGYCSFFSTSYTKIELESYVKTLLAEILLFKQQFSFEADTVYFGGGTPSLLSAEQINSILDLINPLVNSEITLEANPIQITPDWVTAIAQTKINRLSLGLQSMHNDNLKALGRKHISESISDRMKLLRDYGFDNISLDLLYGLPYFTNWNIEQELEQYLALRPEHISTYLLTIEDNAPFKHWKSILPDEAATEKQYNTICATLTANGFEQYEISNFGKPGYLSKHNLHYWLGDDFLGLGAGASGFIQKQRYRKPEDIREWELSVEKRDLLFEQETETLTQQKADFIIMQLRLTRGLELKTYKERFGSDFQSDFNETVKKYIATGYLEAENGFVRLAPKARFVSNHILQEFV
jgi:oxygen-independent coproporphyrinogen III oxidase